MYRLEFANTSRSHGHNLVLDDLTFTVRPGRVTGFLGPNGAGRFTAMKIALRGQGRPRSRNDRRHAIPRDARTILLVGAA